MTCTGLEVPPAAAAAAEDDDALASAEALAAVEAPAAAERGLSSTSSPHEAVAGTGMVRAGERGREEEREREGKRTREDGGKRRAKEERERCGVCCVSAETAAEEKVNEGKEKGEGERERKKGKWREAAHMCLLEKVMQIWPTPLDGLSARRIEPVFFSRAPCSCDAPRRYVNAVLV